MVDEEQPQQSNTSAVCLGESVRPKVHQSSIVSILLLKRQQPLLLQVLCDLCDRILNALLIATDVNLRVLRGLIRAADACELRDLARARKLVQTLWVAGLCDLKRQVDKDLDELEGRVVALDFGVQRAGGCTVGGERRDEGCDCDCGRVGKELCDLRGN